ncbi:adenylate kinase-like [Bicyclus anynana]|uniref:Adenylate kinase-like n=1 Tax=Bicyclus anynana TaxID=110368 RepID=A0A6J1NDA0_BICAN|nr:adenylate kinase-like [Bicyclus anynana]
MYDMTPIRHLPVIFVNGVPGAGNQTVAQTISSMTGYTMIRPGELVRSEAVKDTARGRLIADKLQSQEDIPEQLTVDIIKEAMLQQQDSSGFILVGFPKNPRMSNMFNRQVKWPEKVVALEVDTEVAASRLQSKLSELGRPAAEISSARQIVREAANKVKSVHKRFGGHVITLDSSSNPKALATTLKQMLFDTIEKGQRRQSKLQIPISASAPATNSPSAPATNSPMTNAPVANAPVANASMVNAPVANASVANAPVGNASVVNAPVADAPLTSPPPYHTPSYNLPTYESVPSTLPSDLQEA